MPLYTYLCAKCEKTFDLLLGMTQEKTSLKCPHCASTDLERQPPIFGIKGSQKDSCSSCSGGSCSTCSH